MTELTEKLVKVKALKDLGQKVFADYATKAALQELTTQVGEISGKDYQTGEQVDEKIKAQVGSAYKAKGSLAFELLPEPEESLLGNVYNVTNDFTAGDKFLESEQGKEYPAGTNVAVVSDEADGYKYDALVGMTDLSEYVKEDEVNTALGDKLGKTESAESSKKLTTESAGDETYPVYFENGIPVQCAHKVEKDVPAEAVFTDTTYKPATTDTEGLMSGEDKKKLDGMEIASDEEITQMISEIFSPAA